MKNIFENIINNGNPFAEGEIAEGDEKNKMNEEINENEIIEEASDMEDNMKSEPEIQADDSDKIKEVNETEKLQADYEDLNNRYLRMAADFDNYRKRQAQERESLVKFGAEECMKKILEVVDNFDRAKTMIEKTEDTDKLKEMFFVLDKQLNDSLIKLGLEQIKCVGEAFDPVLHEAVMQTHTEEYPEGTVTGEMQKGYKFGDKVLRPAMVSVAVKD